MNNLKNILRRIYKIPIYIYSSVLIFTNLECKSTFKRFNILSRKYENVYLRFSQNRALDRKSEGYHWDSWSGKIRNRFRKKVPLNFLSDPLIAYTMVLGGNGWGSNLVAERVLAAKKIFDTKELSNLLVEDSIGLPILSNNEFLTSANRAHHVAHLAFYSKMTGDRVWASEIIFEWGGGYGSMARLIRKMNNKVTYIISDLPELLALQYVYLGALEGVENLNLVCSANNRIVPGKINLIPSELLLSGDYNINCDIFMSTWALTECPLYIQEFVYKNKFFNAREVFIASLIDANNWLNSKVKMRNDLKVLTVPFLEGEHEYWVFNDNAR